MARRGARPMAVVGLLIGLGGACALAWNEHRLARQLDAVAAAREGLAEGAAVHVVGEIRAPAPVRDPEFAIAADGVRLERTAETYLWREHREGSGDNKVLRYEKVWSPTLIASERFERRSTHVNPRRLRVESASFRAEDVRVDGEGVDVALVDQLPPTRELRPDDDVPVRAGTIAFRRSGDWLFSGDPASPAIGDVRVRFAVAPEGKVSLVAAREDGRLAPFRAPAGGNVALAAYGDVPAEALLGAAARAGWRDA